MNVLIRVVDKWQLIDAGKTQSSPGIEIARVVPTCCIISDTSLLYRKLFKLTLFTSPFRVKWEYRFENRPMSI